MSEASGVGADELRALAHDLRGAIGALDHQTHLLATGGLAPDLHERSMSSLRANVDELRRLLATVERLASSAQA